MSGHIQDLWYSPGPRGSKDRPTARHGHGLRWKARYTDPDSKERSKSFARKADAERFLTEIEHSKLSGSYLDPDAGRVTLGSRVPVWLTSLTCDPSTRHNIKLRVEKHIVPKLGGQRLDVLTRTPSLIQSWVAGLPVGPDYAAQILSDLSAIFDQAVTDSLVPRNPVRAASIRAPRPDKRKLVPWTGPQAAAVRAALPARYRAMVDAGTDLGVRQGECFGLSLDEIDWLRRRVTIAHQVKLYMGVTRVFGPPKGGKDRVIPLPRQGSEALARHIEEFPPVAVTLPWQTPDGKPRTYELLFTDELGCAMHRGLFNMDAWGPARKAAGLADDRENGQHALRHRYASVLLRNGVDIKRVSAWLGHHSAGFTLSVYSHLMPDDEERSLREIEAALSAGEHNTVASRATEV
jgi:integrase